MLVSEILNKIDLKAASPYSQDEKIAFLNTVIEDIKRFAGVTEIFKFTSSGLKMYPLPTFIAGECIKSVSVNGREIAPAVYGESGDSFFFLMPSGFIGFSSAPKKGDAIEILYSALIQVSDADDEAEIDCEYVPLLVAGAAADIAAAMEDISLANNLRSEYNRLYAEGLQKVYRKKGCYPRTKARLAPTRQ